MDKIVNTNYDEQEKPITEMVLSIIIPCYNNSNYTKSLLKDLLKLPADHQIVIVDNGSTDDTCAIVHEFIETRSADSPLLTYVGCPRNLGFGRGSNKGYKHSKGKNILFLNNDVRVTDNHKTWTKNIIEQCKEECLIAKTCGVLDDHFNFLTEQDAIRTSDLSQIFRINTLEEKPQIYLDLLKTWDASKNKYLSGWCLAGSKKTFDKLILNHYMHDVTDKIEEGKAWGPWNEKFFAYFEDGDLSWRAEELSIKLKTMPIDVHHFKRMTGKKMDMQGMYKQSQQIFRGIWKERLKK
jgi:GT2 family glycosyltransferase